MMARAALLRKGDTERATVSRGRTLRDAHAQN